MVGEFSFDLSLPVLNWGISVLNPSNVSWLTWGCMKGLSEETIVRRLSTPYAKDGRDPYYILSQETSAGEQCYTLLRKDAGGGRGLGRRHQGGVVGGGSVGAGCLRRAVSASARRASQALRFWPVRWAARTQEDFWRGRTRSLTMALAA